MALNNKKAIFSRSFLINKFGQIHVTKNFLFFFSLRFYRFVFQNR